MQTVKPSPPTDPKSQDSSPVSNYSAGTGEPYSAGPSVADLVWRFFCSTRLALIIILLIAVATLLGTILLQAPSGISSDPAAYAQWLPRARAKYGAIADLMSALQLFDVFNSLWFRLLAAGLILNIIVCTINRWDGLWRSIKKPRVRMGDGFFRKASHSVVLNANGAGSAATAEAVREALASQRYRVLTEHDERRSFLYADKNRWGKMGTFLNHLSLVLILVGAIIGNVSSFGAFHEKEFMVAIGSQRALGHDTGLTLRVDDFVDEYYPEGPPKDYRTEAVLLKNDTEVGRHTIRVNDPLEYDGVRFYQAFFGPAVNMIVKDGDGSVIFNDGVPLPYRDNQERPVGSFNLPAQRLEVYILAPFSGRADPLVPAGQMRLQTYRLGLSTATATDNVVMGKPKKIGDLEFNFVRETQFTGLQVARDPGVPIIWLACALMVIGLIMVLYFPHRRIWAVVRPNQDEQMQVTLGATARRDGGFDAEFRRVVGSVEGYIRGPRQ